ncbi:hypothetical protein WJ47_35250 [Burkholderia ubonensis]|nr:hypothetical protein [Burkholderia ubonensis]KVK79966.1 hypothetical protein WJ44_01250 [Burkholderia ubonensis]KVL74537.1 hypothetical protein WJ47_35250 [Burkholderia ubonensis]KVR15250.1 hypothetical protein WK11_28625 [Burkholderia ubonensis]
MASKLEHIKECHFHDDNQSSRTLFVDAMMPTRLMIHPIMPERRVKRGFNWGALIFGTMWAYSEGLVALRGRLIANVKVTNNKSHSIGVLCRTSFIRE